MHVGFEKHELLLTPLMRRVLPLAPPPPIVKVLVPLALGLAGDTVTVHDAAAT